MTARVLVVACSWVALALFPQVLPAAQAKRVAVVPFEIYADKDLSSLARGFRDLLASRIAADPRVSLAGSASVEAAVKKSAQGGAEDLPVEILAKELGADAVVWGSLTVFGKSTSINLTLRHFGGGAEIRHFSFTTGNPDEVLPRLNALAGEIQLAILQDTVPGPVSLPPAVSPAAPRGEGVFPFQGAAPWVSDDLPFAVRGLTVGDVDADGRNEIVLIDESSVRLYRFDDRQLTALAVAKGKAYDNYVAVSLGPPPPQGGRRRVLVTSIRDVPRTSVLEYEGGALRTVGEDMRFFVRGVEGMGQGETLLGQEMSSKGWPFQGEIFLVASQGAGYSAGAQADLPKGFALYHFASGDLVGDGSREDVAVDGQGRLRVYGASKEFVGEGRGGSLASCVGWERDRSTGNSDPAASEEMSIPVGMLVRDLDADGARELLVAKNAAGGWRELLGGGASHEGAQVAGLKWEGGRFVSVGTIEDVGGCVVGIALKDVDGDGAEEFLAASVQERGLGWGRATSVLKIYFHR